MYCMKCGKELPDSAKFCKYCGTPLEESESNKFEEVTINNHESENDTVPEKNRKTKGIGSVLFTLLLSIIFFILFLIKGGSWFWLILVFVCLLIAFSIKYKRNYCPKCFKKKELNAKKCPHCGYDEKNVVPLFLEIILLIAIIFVFMINGISKVLSNYKKSNNVSTSNNYSSEKNTSTRLRNHLTLKTYKDYFFAVEVDDYNGKIFKAGIYEADNTNKTAKKAGIYDIYVRSQPDIPKDELGEADYSIGGIDGYATEISLKKGDYVYIIPYAGISYVPDDILNLKFKNNNSADSSDIEFNQMNDSDNNEEQNNEENKQNEETEGKSDIIWFDKSLGLYQSTVETKAQIEYGIMTIYGGVGNASSKDYSYVEIVYSIYDDNGNKTGDAMTNTLGLKSGESWRFEAIGKSGGGTKYKFESISAW